ncbi:unknown protein [Simkania negevensis Z]|uniref:Uncharacterized protein n=1 Tax=Simkania negevensis (strain ATCC VR-1471 / DSM 27360 / Z) TaxID=331113 RepID=F8L5U6_SIMNZ|nr:unknown protein [Simkania negevensis Z]
MLFVLKVILLDADLILFQKSRSK